MKCAAQLQPDRSTGDTLCPLCRDPIFKTLNGARAGKLREDIAAVHPTLNLSFASGWTKTDVLGRPIRRALLVDAEVAACALNFSVDGLSNSAFDGCGNVNEVLFLRMPEHCPCRMRAIPQTMSQARARLSALTPRSPDTVNLFAHPEIQYGTCICQNAIVSIMRGVNQAGEALDSNWWFHKADTDLREWLNGVDNINCPQLNIDLSPAGIDAINEDLSVVLDAANLLRIRYSIDPRILHEINGSWDRCTTVVADMLQEIFAAPAVFFEGMTSKDRILSLLSVVGRPDAQAAFRANATTSTTIPEVHAAITDQVATRSNTTIGSGSVQQPLISSPVFAPVVAPSSDTVCDQQLATESGEQMFAIDQVVIIRNHSEKFDGQLGKISTCRAVPGHQARYSVKVDGIAPSSPLSSNTFVHVMLLESQLQVQDSLRNCHFARFPRAIVIVYPICVSNRYRTRRARC